MELLDKLEILADSAKYDVSCSSSGSDRKNTNGGVGNGHIAGICHSWSEDGRCISLLKVLFSNDCVYDCKYCVNKISNDIPRASFTSDELAELTIGFYRRNYIEGLFLSSAVTRNPDFTMEQMIASVKKLRNQYKFNGYIHMKAIPGADPRLIYEAGIYVDRMSINIELPSEQGLKLLAPQKNKKTILAPMNYISNQIEETRSLRKAIRNTPQFVPAGQSTQLMVGATNDSDFNIIRLSQGLYDKFSMKRVYYSAYVPINKDPDLPTLYTTSPMLREHRLYQADWLLRFYKFRADELLDQTEMNFDSDVDPKCQWALRNIHLFPVEINTVDYEMLLRVPGIGVQSALRIIKARRLSNLTYEHLKKMRIVLKRARYFITCNGKYFGGINTDKLSGNTVKALLTDNAEIDIKSLAYKQISFFDKPDMNWSYSTNTTNTLSLV